MLLDFIYIFYNINICIYFTKNYYYLCYTKQIYSKSYFLFTQILYTLYYIMYYKKQFFLEHEEHFRPSNSLIKIQ